MAFVNASRGGNTASGATIPATAAAHTAGNLLTAWFRHDLSGVSTITGVADTAGNTWHQAGTVHEEGEGGVYANGSWQYLYYAYNCLGHATNVVTATISGACTGRGFSVLQFSLMQAASDPLLDVEFGTGNSPSIATPVLTVSQSAVLVAGLLGAGGSIVGGAGYTCTPFDLGDASLVFADEYKALSASEAMTATHTTQVWSIFGAAFATIATTSAYKPISRAFPFQPGSARRRR
jgi:hypothetical protein